MLSQITLTITFGYCRTSKVLRPIPLSNKEITNEERFKILTRLVDFVNENQLQIITGLLSTSILCALKRAESLCDI